MNQGSSAFVVRRLREDQGSWVLQTGPLSVLDDKLGAMVATAKKTPGGGDAVLVALGDQIRRYRNEAGLTQDEVATVVGMHRVNLSRIEAGRQDVSTLRLIAIASALGVRASDLLPSEVSRSANHERQAKVGPFATTSELGRWLGLSRQALHQRMTSFQLLGCKTERGHYLYPMWQFDPETHAFLPGLAAVLQILRPDAATAWAAAEWLTTPHVEWGGRTPTDLLHLGDLNPVLVKARGWGTDGTESGC